MTTTRTVQHQRMKSYALLLGIIVIEGVLFMIQLHYYYYHQEEQTTTAIRSKHTLNFGAQKQRQQQQQRQPIHASTSVAKGQ